MSSGNVVCSFSGILDGIFLLGTYIISTKIGQHSRNIWSKAWYGIIVREAAPRMPILELGLGLAKKCSGKSEQELMAALETHGRILPVVGSEPAGLMRKQAMKDFSANLAVDLISDLQFQC